MDQGRAQLELVVDDQEEVIPQERMKVACTQEGGWQWGVGDMAVFWDIQKRINVSCGKYHSVSFTDKWF